MGREAVQDAGRQVWMQLIEKVVDHDECAMFQPGCGQLQVMQDALARMVTVEMDEAGGPFQASHPFQHVELAGQHSADRYPGELLRAQMGLEIARQSGREVVVVNDQRVDGKHGFIAAGGARQADQCLAEVDADFGKRARDPDLRLVFQQAWSARACVLCR